MSRRNNLHKRKNVIRSALSGKIINGREVVLTEEAIEYVKKMGLIVEKPFGKILEKAIGFIFFFLLITPLISPLISAQPELFIMDFSQRQNQIIMLVVFAIAVILIYLSQTLWGGTLILIGGML